MEDGIGIWHSLALVHYLITAVYFTLNYILYTMPPMKVDCVIWGYHMFNRIPKLGLVCKSITRIQQATNTS